MTEPSEDERRVRELGRDLPAVDVDSISAERIARAARRGPTPRRRIEAIGITLLVAIFVAWALYHAFG